MARSVTVQSGYNQIQLPGGVLANEGQTVILTDEQFEQLDQSLLGTELSDDGPTASSGDAVVSQAANVADIADTGTATLVDVGNKVNEILAALKGNGKPMAPDA